MQQYLLLFKVFSTTSIFPLQAFPCIFAMLTDRNQSTYERVISMIEDKWSLNLTKTWVDYERTLRNAVTKCYPQIEIRAFWYQYCLAVRRKCNAVNGFYEFVWDNPLANVLYHKFLCLALLPQSHIIPALNLLKSDSEQYEIFQPVVEYIEKVFIKREKPENVSIERNLFATLCSLNYNDSLKKKFFMPNKTTSLIDLILLIQREAILSLRRFESAFPNTKGDTSRQSHFIKKEYDNFEKSDTKDIREFLARLSFSDNTGSVTKLDNYVVDDEADFAENDDGDYDNATPDQAAVAEAPVLEAPVAREECCIICLENSKTTMLEPCNHLKYCATCVDYLLLPSYDEYGVLIIPKCPYCRAIISGRRTVFF